MCENDHHVSGDVFKVELEPPVGVEVLLRVAADLDDVEESVGTGSHGSESSKDFQARVFLGQVCIEQAGTVHHL